MVRDNSKTIKEKVKNNNSKIEIYTTLEPCLMCLGSIVLNRISRVIFGCFDPFAGATRVKSKDLSAWYVKNWPEISGGLFGKESCKLILDFMKLGKSQTLKEEGHIFEELYRKM